MMKLGDRSVRSQIPTAKSCRIGVWGTAYQTKLENVQRKNFKYMKSPESFLQFIHTSRTLTMLLSCFRFSFKRSHLFPNEWNGTKALFRLGARARPLCPDTKKDVVHTPWYPRSNHVLVRHFSARHFVYGIVGRHEEKTWGLTKSCSDQYPCPGTVPACYPWRQSPCPGTMPKFLLGHRHKSLFRLVPVPENRERVPSLNGALFNTLSVAPEVSTQRTKNEPSSYKITLDLL